MPSLILALIAIAEASPRISIASDMTPWFLQGYSGIVMLEPDGSDLRLGFEAWGMRYPAALVDLYADNADEGWARRIALALAVYVDWHPAGAGEGWHVGGALDLLRSEVTREGATGSGQFWSGEILARGGYRWFPRQDWGLFVNPWLAAGPLVALQPPPTIDGETFVEPPVQALGTAHLGWRF